MADWTNIPDATFDPDRPVLGSTHLAIVKNFEALAEGAANAPRIQTAAIQDGNVTTAKIADANVTRAKLPTSTGSVSGSLSSGATVVISLSPYSFFPSFGGITSDLILRAGGGTASADSPRVGISNSNPDDPRSYSVAWRFINV